MGTIPFVIVCGWAWGAPGVLIGQGLGGVAFGVFAWFLARRVMARGGGKRTVEPYARQARLLGLFNFRR